MTALTRGEASAAVEALGWRYLLECLTTTVLVASLAQARDVLDLVVTAAGPDGADHVRAQLGSDRVELTVQSREHWCVTADDAALAGALTAALRGAGRDTVPGPVPHSVQSLEIAIDAMDIAAVRPFWKAVLGYVDRPATASPLADLVDPAGGGASMWFQQMDAPRPQRNRIHLDLTVPHDEAQARVDAALAAGGRLVTDEHARAFWVLADAEGNEVCVCTWQDRD